MPDNPRFATTQWTLVRAAGLQSAEGARALAELCSIYWYPIFAMVRRRGHSAEEAQDLTQSFFTRLIEKNDVTAADADRGRFRTFLLSACENFLRNAHDRAVALKRGGGRHLIPIDVALAEERYHRAASHGETPEVLYQRQWVRELLNRALHTLSSEYAANGRSVLFARLRGFVTDAEDAGPYAEAARDLDMSVDAVKVAVHRLRRRFREAVRQEIAGTVDSPAAVDAEIRDLFSSL